MTSHLRFTKIDFYDNLGNEYKHREDHLGLIVSFLNNINSSIVVNVWILAISFKPEKIFLSS